MDPNFFIIGDDHIRPSHFSHMDPANPTVPDSQPGNNYEGTDLPVQQNTLLEPVLTSPEEDLFALEELHYETSPVSIKYGNLEESEAKQASPQSRRNTNPRLNATDFRRKNSTDSSLSFCSSLSSSTSHVLKKGNAIFKSNSHSESGKKYRDDINKRFRELKQIVPTLRWAEGSFDFPIERLEGLVPPVKISRAQVLAKSIEYIRHLEMKNDLLIKENSLTKHRLGNILMIQQQQQQQRQQPHMLPPNAPVFQIMQQLNEEQGQEEEGEMESSSDS